MQNDNRSQPSDLTLARSLSNQIQRMAELQIHYDRYSSVAVAAQIEPDRLQFEGDEAYIEVSLADDEASTLNYREFAVYFDAPDEDVEPALFDVAKQLMEVISHLDNLVQEDCAEKCSRSGLHPRNFEGELGYIRVYHDRALLRYWGTSVNTEWDELVRFENSTWSYAGTVPPKNS